MSNEAAPAVFTREQVVRVLRVPQPRIDYWIGHGLVAPDVNQRVGGGRFVRLFTFEQLVELRVVAWLTGKGIRPSDIQPKVERLRDRGFAHPLRDVTWGIVGKHGRDRLVFKNPDGTWESTLRVGQLMLVKTVPLIELEQKMRRRVDRDQKRQRRHGQVERRRGALGSASVLAGTRIPTAAIARLRRAGYDTARILQEYPQLTVADVDAALQHELERTG